MARGDEKGRDFVPSKREKGTLLFLTSRRMRKVVLRGIEDSGGEEGGSLAAERRGGKKSRASQRERGRRRISLYLSHTSRRKASRSGGGKKRRKKRRFYKHKGREESLPRWKTSPKTFSPIDKRRREGVRADSLFQEREKERKSPNLVRTRLL